MEPATRLRYFFSYSSLMCFHKLTVVIRISDAHLNLHKLLIHENDYKVDGSKKYCLILRIE